MVILYNKAIFRGKSLNNSELFLSYERIGLVLLHRWCSFFFFLNLEFSCFQAFEILIEMARTFTQGSPLFFVYLLLQGWLKPLIGKNLG